jgi:hypothetical protein
VKKVIVTALIVAVAVTFVHDLGAYVNARRTVVEAARDAADVAAGVATSGRDAAARAAADSAADSGATVYLYDQDSTRVEVWGKDRGRRHMGVRTVTAFVEDRPSDQLPTLDYRDRPDPIENRRALPMKTIVLDTNVLLADPQALLAFPDAEVVIPETVLGELDKLKTSRVDPDLRFRGREVSRMLFELSEQGSLIDGVDLPDGGRCGSCLLIPIHRCLRDSRPATPTTAYSPSRIQMCTTGKCPTGSPW